jgi:FkbM family methyltransferase
MCLGLAKDRDMTAPDDIAWLDFDGFSLAVRSDVLGDQMAFLRLKWEWWITEALERLPWTEDSVFVDVGAGYGVFLAWLRAGKSNARYVGFEPNRRHFECMRLALERNQDRRAIVYPFGLWSKHSVGYLEPAFRNPIDRIRETPEDSQQWAEVPLVVMDDILASIGQPTAIKVDVEGGEWNVLLGGEGLLRTYHPHLIVEFCPSNMESLTARPDSALEMIEWLWEIGGYENIEILDRHTDPAGIFKTPASFSAFCRTHYHSPTSICDLWITPSDAGRKVAQ